jgi:hypothetical protein
VRGDYGRGATGGAHAWNVVIMYGQEWLCDVMHRPGVLYEEGSEVAELYKRLPQRRGQDSGGGAGMASIQPLRTSTAFDHLSAYEVPPGDLAPCLDSADNPCVLGKGGFGVVVKARLLGHNGFVAVKRVRDDLASPDMMAEFKKEVLVLFSLRHAHVAGPYTRPRFSST